MPAKTPKNESGPPQSRGPSKTEFYRYRRFLGLSLVTFAVLGSTWVLASVGVDIYRRRHPEPTAGPTAVHPTKEGLQECVEALEFSRMSLEKHLEDFHKLLGSYDSTEAQDWGASGVVWRRNWKRLGQRCEPGVASEGPIGNAFRDLEALHDELGALHKTYTVELQRFNSQLAPRMERLRKKVKKVRGQIASLPREEDES